VVGSLYLRPILAIRDAGYDSNVFLTPEQPINDTTATFSGGLRIAAALGGGGSVSVQPVADYVYYADNSDESGLNFRTDGDLIMALSSFRLSLGGDLAWTRERYSLEVDERARRRDARVNAGFRTDPERGLSFELAGHFETLRFERDNQEGERLARSLDRDSYRGALLGYLEFGASHLQLGFSRGRDDYKLNNVRDADDTRVFGGIILDPQGTLVGEFRLGWENLEPDDVTRTDYNSVFFDGEIRYVPHEDARFTVGLDHKPRPSSFQRNVFYESTVLDLDLLRFITYHWGVRAGFLYAAHRYPEATEEVEDGTISLSPPRSDDISVASFGVVYRAFRNFHVGVNAQYKTRDSNIDSFDNSRWMLTTTMGFLP
jgi:hypothetical protein